MAVQSDADPENTISVLVATDCHLGYSEKDQVRGNDSLSTFEEILQIAKDKKVDFILLGGDLFHENKPSRKTLHGTMAMFRKYCMGDKPCQLEFLSDQSVNFSNSRFPVVNYEDPNYNISIPVFSIHGNHDDPAGDGNLCALDLLSVCGFVNYFGRAASIDDITVSPILIQKGRAKLALYGLGSIRDERLHRTFLNQKIKMLRPKEDSNSWFNVFVLHQNRSKHGMTNYIPEKFLDDFLDLVIWGHEHECIIDPKESEDPNVSFYVSQPGSSVATSLCEGEAKTKHVAILEIREKGGFRMTKVKLETVRPFYIEDVVLSNTDIDPTQEERVMAYLVEKVEQLIEKAGREHSGNPRQPDKPLIRIRVDYSDGFTSFNTRRFGQQFVDRVANPKDILLFYRRKTHPTKGDKKNQGDTRIPHLHPEALDTIRMEDLIKEYLTSKDNALELCILTEGRMAQALREFVEKDEKEAISALVKWQLDQAQKHLKARRNVCEENIETEVVKHTETVRQREEEDDTMETEDIRKVLQESRASQLNNDDDHNMNGSGSSDDDRPSTIEGIKPNTSTVGKGDERGRGRGRGRGARGRGRAAAGTSRTIMDSINSASKRRRPQKKVPQEIISDDDDDNSESNVSLASSAQRTRTTRPSTSQVSMKGKMKKEVITCVVNEDDSDDSDDPFSMQPSNKRSRR
ncbi:PREDICTED: double-strand break repair protein MRE11-like [Acropora digitifera]|uniref:double-strand break repair protein MRE11-like n=1 Tax=Acropora digitifera TaxID=70779 RepID=UPI00077A7579|nr:PREDICTED: double-strand break repair protein MRE11-like [Acropora digitifera]